MWKNILQRQRKVLAQGETSPNSKRQSAFIQGVYPTHLVQGDGCYVFDGNGRRYIDYIGGLGTNLLGYAHPKVTEAAYKAIKLGVNLSLPHPIEVEVAERISELIPCAEKVRFLKTGNEATLAAVRIARAYAEKKVIRSDGYHGHGDLWTSLTPPAAGVCDEFFVSKNGGDIYITEPLKLDLLELSKRPEWCDVLIFDEIVTGFRVKKYCIANQAIDPPEMICLGKAISNGFPLSVVAGKREVMDCGPYFISSTFSGEVVSLYAAKAVLEFLETNHMDSFWDYCDTLRNKMNDIFKEIDVHIEGYATRGQLDTSQENVALLMQEACKGGILLGKAWFPSWAHMEAGVEEMTLSILADCVNRIRKGHVKLEGEWPQQSFTR